jgi:prepilin peptidase CpaA
MSATQIVLIGLLLLSGLSGYVDFRTGHIPNRLMAVGAALGVLVHIGVHVGLLHEPGQSWAQLLGGAVVNLLVGLLGCAAVPLLLYRVSAMGGGDVKLLACVGIWAGPIIGVQIELYAFVAASVYACARLAYHGQLLRLLGNSAALMKNPFVPKARREEVPAALLTELRFGPAVFAATALITLVRWSGG